MQKNIIFIFFIFFIGCATTQLEKENLSGTDLLAASQEILATDTSFDLEKGEIQYTLPQPALVRIRIGLDNGGPLIRTLVDWQRREAGPSVEAWDKRDDSGMVDFSRQTNLMLVLNCLPLDDQGGVLSSTTVRGPNRSPHFSLTLSGVNEFSENIPVVKGVVPVQIILAEEDKQWLTESRYEISVYVDQILIGEEEEGLSPFTYLLNTEGFNDGNHLITVNIAGYSGEVGTQSKMMLVKNEEVVQQ
ncbi:MAG: hypothetical protein A2787_00795 [Omnitrophica WOR_2 bacterium RIFCSPHIGHO2_01_FULL_48_9]|nr:MAG: hypothetical protein A3D10_04520 [Omnitrophica WOR_2 bacterium RIFCSPHIGHO2_02_FULL_48_11]OGX31648.1 MAG: hypothetical protein A2787_00795 [Omnitrophica WOR_2 bacterium RIFCSPHIGHO2_01_FULL_48_9]